MEKKRINAALTMIFGASGLIAGSVAQADSLTGSLTGPAGTVQTSNGPSFNFTTNQIFYTSLSPGYSGYLVGDLASGIMSAQAVTGGVVSPPGDGLATTTYTTIITNTGSAAQAYSFSYYIGSGTLISDPVFSYPNGRGSVISTIGASIAVNGSTEWSYNASLNGSATGPYSGETFNLTTSANAPAYSVTPIQGNLGEMVSFSAFGGSFALGTLAAGASETVTYTLTGQTTTLLGGGALEYYGGGIAQIGDPFSVQGQGLTTFGVSSAGAVSAVPEPATTVMLATGAVLLAGLALRRRRQQANPATGALA